MADEINSLAEQIRMLNIQIASTEGGDTSASEAGGLRVKRQTAVDRLSELLGINVAEQPSGGVSISVGGEFLVFEGQRREVAGRARRAGTEAASGVIEFVGTHSPLTRNDRRIAGTVYEPATRSSAGSSTSWTTWPARWRSNSTKCIRRARAWSASIS